MLMPKRVKRRKVQRGRMTGKATRGNFIAYGDYGIQALECGWMTSNQIEAARIAINRYIKRGGKLWIKVDLVELKWLELKDTMKELFHYKH